MVRVRWIAATRAHRLRGIEIFEDDPDRNHTRRDTRRLEMIGSDFAAPAQFDRIGHNYRALMPRRETTAQVTHSTTLSTWNDSPAVHGIPGETAGE